MLSIDEQSPAPHVVANGTIYDDGVVRFRHVTIEFLVATGRTGACVIFLLHTSTKRDILPTVL